jgi:hypothetical protein
MAPGNVTSRPRRHPGPTDGIEPTLGGFQVCRSAWRVQPTGTLAQIFIGILGTATTLAVTVAPAARADYGCTVQQTCVAKAPSAVPMNIVASPDVTCARLRSSPRRILASPLPVPRLVADFRAGPYSTDPSTRGRTGVVLADEEVFTPLGPKCQRGAGYHSYSHPRANKTLKPHITRSQHSAPPA